MDSRTVLPVCGLVAYDGTDYCGFQVQVGVPTIQGELEAALAHCTEVAGRVVGAGRTDTGVHAQGQVIAVPVVWSHAVADLQRAWNAHLPASIAVRRLQVAPERFHPRFSATARTYRYTVWDHEPPGGYPAPKHLPLTDRYGLSVAQRLDLAAMQTAASQLIGEHDFAAFGQPPQGTNSVRRVYAADWQVVSESLPPLHGEQMRRLVFTICANAFLRQMVRSIVGTLLEVGIGRRQPDTVRALLLSRQRAQSAPPAPVQGLVLERVDYPPTLGLNF